MQSGRRARLSVAGPSPQPQETITNSPSISGDLRLLHTIDCGDQLLCCQFNNDGSRVAAGLRTGAIKFSSYKSSEPYAYPHIQTKEGQLLSQKNAIDFLQLFSRIPDKMIPWMVRRVNLGTGIFGGICQVYSVNDGSLHHILADHETKSLGLPTTSLHFMPRGPAHNGDVLLTTYSGGKVKLWHVSTHTCVCTITEDRQTLAACFNPSGSMFLTAGAGPGIYMYDAQTWDKLQTFLPSDSPTVMDGHMSRIYALTFFPENNERFISGGWDDTVQFWNTHYPHSQRRISGPHICGDALSIDKTGSQILTGSWRRHNTLQIWDAETSSKIMDIPEDFRGHSQLYTCHFLGTDYIIAGGSRNNLCRLIDRRILMSTGALNDLPGGVYSTDISCRGVLAATSNNFLYLAQTPVKP